MPPAVEVDDVTRSRRVVADTDDFNLVSSGPGQASPSPCLQQHDTKTPEKKKEAWRQARVAVSTLLSWQ